MPLTRAGRVALAILAGGVVAGLVATWLGTAFRVAAIVGLAGLVVTALAVRAGERSLFLLIPAAILLALSVGFLVAQWGG